MVCSERTSAYSSYLSERDKYMDHRYSLYIKQFLLADSHPIATAYHVIIMFSFVWHCVFVGCFVSMNFVCFAVFVFPSKEIIDRITVVRAIGRRICRFGLCYKGEGGGDKHNFYVYFSTSSSFIVSILWSKSRPH